MADSVMQAGRAAIARAKRCAHAEVSPDDLLVGVLQVVARFDVVRIGPWTIDLERLGEKTPAEFADGPRVSYSPETAAVFDRAALIARRDGSPRTEAVHLLVAFASEESGMMGRLKEVYGISSAAWRAALAEWSPARSGGDVVGTNGAARPAARVPELLSPDEAAEMLGVHTQTVRGYIRSGKLPAHRLAGERAIRILRRDVFALLEPVRPEDDDNDSS